MQWERVSWKVHEKEMFEKPEVKKADDCDGIHAFVPALFCVFLSEERVTLERGRTNERNRLVGWWLERKAGMHNW